MPHRSIIAVLGIVVAIVAVCGCETMSADLGDLAKSFSSPTPLQAAVMAADQYDADRRREGIVLLSNAPFGGNPPYLAMYRDYTTTDRNPLVRAAAIRALARYGETSDAPMIAEQLVHENAQVRWEAAKGLQRLHEPEVVPVLLAVLRRVDEEPDVRVASATALGQYPEDRVFQGLVAALDARELALGAAALVSLETLTGKAHGLDSSSWVRWYDSTPEPFAGRQEFKYPTYQRDESFLEKMAFWTVPAIEYPAPPSGLPGAGRRSTYGPDEQTRGQPGAATPAGGADSPGAGSGNPAAPTQPERTPPADEAPIAEEPTKGERG